MSRLNQAALATAVILLSITGAASASAQVATPPRGSVERTAILDAAREPVRRQIGKPVIFVVKRLRVLGDWAFLEAEPRNPDGSRVDYKGTPFEADERAGAFGGLVHALLQKVGGRWHVATLVIGASDVPYVDWWRRFGAPRAVLPYSQ